MQSTYRVLARRYRPTRLRELIGQEMLVKTLAQALREERLPHAIILHGTRGIGKTTTARILAKALNCLKNEEADPCGICESCLAIDEGRFLDVVEMDAASHTSVDDIRSVIDAAQYKAVVGRCKVYIIDEVHMLSKSAFNALLKTLEEPPGHVKFIFATTELRRVPETILSRCMRFDLRRLEVSDLVSHLKSIAIQENITLDPIAAELLAQAADGSARDALSLLDQAIALSGAQVSADVVRSMLGLVDRQSLIDLLANIVGGGIVLALEKLQEMLKQGGDPVFITEGLLELVYHLTCLKTSPASGKKLLWAPAELSAAQTFVSSIEISVLMQAWQVLSKGLREIQQSSLPTQACEMVLIRLAYLSPLPSAHDLLEALNTGSVPNKTSSPVLSLPKSFEEVIALVQQAREPILFGHLIQDVHLVSYQPGKIVLRPTVEAPKSLAQQFRQVLERMTEVSWLIQIVEEGGVATVYQQKAEEQRMAEQASYDHPVVQSFLEAFPGATIGIEKEI